MRKYLTPFIAGLLLSGLASSVSAQVSNAALGEAKARLACGAGTVVSSVFLPSGSLQVTCARPPTESTSASASTAVQATGLAASTSLAAVAAVGVLVVIVGGGGSGATTTTTTTTTTTSGTGTNSPIGR